MNPLPEGIDPDSEVTAGSFRQNGNLLANASCEERRGRQGPKMECCWIATRKWKLRQEKLLDGASIVWLEGEVGKNKEVVPKAKSDITNSR